MLTQSIIVLVLYFVGMLAIGIYCNKKYAGSLSGFLAGGRSLGPWLFAFVYGSTYLSSSTLVGTSAAGYKAGISWLFMPIPQVVFIPLGILLFSHGLRKMSKRMDVYTVPEFLARRYKSSGAGLITSIVIILFMIPYMISVVKGGALSLGALLGVPYFWSVILVAGVAGVYIITGGYMARTYTDLVQAILMFFGVLLVAVAGLIAVGGPSGVATSLAAQDPELVSTPGPMGWSQIALFATVFGISPWGLPQLVQTNFTFKKRSVVYTSAIVLSFWACVVLFGTTINSVVGRAMYGDALLENVDALFPTMVMDLFPNFIGAIIICAVLAAAMSTLDGILMTAGSSFACDIYQKFLKKNASEKQVLRMNSIAMMIIIVIVVIGAMNPPKMMLTLTSYAFSVIAGCLMIPIFGGIYTKKGTTAGCLAGIIAGGVSTLLWYIIKIDGGYILGIPPFITGIVVSCIAYFAVSAATKKLPEDFVNDLFSKEASLAAYDEE